MLKRGLILLIFLLSFSLVAGLEYVNDDFLGGYSSGGGFFSYGDDFLSNFDIAQFYQEYGAIIDGVIFLLVFIGAGIAAFGERFKGGSRNIYVGLGILFTFALMLWEKRNSFYLLNEFGPIAFIIFMTVVLVVVFNFFKSAGATGVYAVAIVYIVFFFAFGYYVDDANHSTARSFLDNLPWIETLKIVMLVLLGLAAIVLVFGLFTAFRRKEP
ncbi:hypothetical protein HYT58_00005 [Candidatus Woesearchaeota archaeon]|nr:hypothetical protein [Candidatus Woesearchaeota archaeon]